MTGRLQTFDFHFDLDQPLHVLVGHDRRAVPVHVVLRHGSEPGAALSVGAVGGRGARVAVHERVLEDSAAGARAARRRVRVRVLPLLAAADALQHRARASRCAAAPRSRSTRSSRRASARRRRVRKQRPSRSRRASSRRRGGARVCQRGVHQLERRDAGRPPAGRDAGQGRVRRSRPTTTSTSCSRRGSRRSCRSAWSAW